MATYSFTSNARQDAYIAFMAARKGVTSQQWVDGELLRLLQRAKNEFDLDEGNRVEAAYLAASNAVQAQVKTDLGLS